MKQEKLRLKLIVMSGVRTMKINYQAMVQARRFDTGSCSESCEIWGEQLELKFEEVVA
ncbi:hypothetical protein DMQ20_004864 [Escherichia coli]|nr:hypothetical protein [Escherichia coli]EHH4589193.1 hypothetical protein [Escherichia coli]EHO4881290.1 hypothetical protein [Escherichia coli]MBB9356552.1 hypothetical protein [Escherichia coli]HBC3244823.1 hypothetical protein [Escherichia coli O146]